MGENRKNINDLNFFLKRPNYLDTLEQQFLQICRTAGKQIGQLDARKCFFLRDSVGFPGAAEYFKRAADEELEHARKFMQYQSIRGGAVKMQTIAQPDLQSLEDTSSTSTSSLLCRAMNLALTLEQRVYSSILSISHDCCDTGLEDFLDDFVQEQLKGQYELGIKIQQLETIGLDGHGLVEYDKTLA